MVTFKANFKIFNLATATVGSLTALKNERTEDCWYVPSIWTLFRDTNMAHSKSSSCLVHKSGAFTATSVLCVSCWMTNSTLLNNHGGIWCVLLKCNLICCLFVSKFYCHTLTPPSHRHTQTHTHTPLHPLCETQTTDGQPTIPAGPTFQTQMFILFICHVNI